MAFDITDPETKKAVEKLVREAADAAVTEATAGLVAKNQELLGKLKKAQKDSTIDPAEHQALQERLNEADQKLIEVQKLAKVATTEAEKAKKALESETKVAHNLVVQNGLTASLIENKIRPEYMDAVVALLSPLATMKADGDKRMAMIGDKPLSDAVGEWAKSDKGKAYVAAPNNTGAGSPGGGGTLTPEGAEKIKDPSARLAVISSAEAAAKK